MAPPVTGWKEDRHTVNLLKKKVEKQDKKIWQKYAILWRFASRLTVYNLKVVQPQYLLFRIALLARGRNKLTASISRKMSKLSAFWTL